MIFYDITTLHFEIDEDDAGGAEGAVLRGSKLAGGKAYAALRQRGKAKNKRSDVPPIVVGVAMSRDGLSVRSRIFRGATVDVSTVKQVKEDFRGWRLTRCVLVGDAGMVSEDNLYELARGGGRYILCMPIRQGTDVADEVVKRAGGLVIDRSKMRAAAKLPPRPRASRQRSSRVAYLTCCAGYPA